MDFKDSVTLFLIIIYIYLTTHSNCENYHYYKNKDKYTTISMCNDSIKTNNIKKKSITTF